MQHTAQHTAQHPLQNTPLISIIIPCYNEMDALPKTILQLQLLCKSLRENTNKILNASNIHTELIFINDGSRDSTLEILQQAASLDSQIKFISFSRNFGHEIATTAGIDAAQGEAVILIDADLQDPPEIIFSMLNKWQEGFDVIYGTRKTRPGESRLKRLSAYLFYRVFNKLSDVSIPVDTGDFRLMSKRVVTAFKLMPEKDRFIRGMISWIGFRQTSVLYERKPRVAGKTKYSLYKQLALATTAVFSFSTKPLKLSVGLGLLSSCLALIGIFLVLGIRLLTHTWVSGWATLMIAILFMGGVQLISIGILGIYIGRLYAEAKNRPLYLIEEKKGFNN